ncbi:methyltransferase family protein [Brevibacterium sanguinis]|uniref:Methyltransferase family protein n=3 Tax=Brevibacteriaceae TaxID=85019 RepID=A0A366IMN3_9MICO|nr:methyltransferase family protein [Brevibacterium sanguinis]RBP74325.1 methyltransferase family protein [Brevibacterium celere]
MRQCGGTVPLSMREMMRPFSELVAEAQAADVTGWGFGWLEGRAVEERPPWRYSEQLARRLAAVASAVDLDTGEGEVIAGVPTLPPTMVVTETFPPNAARARASLEPRGVRVIDADEDPLPLPDATFELVTSRHPVVPRWAEISRLLTPGGHYFAQHVGPASAFELIEFFLGPQPENRLARRPEIEAREAEEHGLVVEELRTARCRMEFFDVGAVVWILRKCPWWVPGFSVEEHLPRLTELDEQMRRGEPFIAHSTRHLIVARR